MTFKPLSSVISILKLLFLSPFYLYDSFRVLFIIRKKEKIKRIYVSHYGWGYGHHIVDPDFLRRIYPADSCMFIFFYSPLKHNKHLISFFTDIVIAHVRVGIDLKIFNKKWVLHLNKPHAMLIYNKLFSKIKQTALNQEVYSQEEFLTQYDTPEYSPDKISGFSIEKEYFGTVLNGRSVEPTIDKDLTNKVLFKLQKRFAVSKEYLLENSVCIYLRYKGNDPNFPSEFLRSSSNLQEYLPAFKYLADNSYFIFLTGDYDYTFVQSIMNSHNIACAESVGVDRSFFSLFGPLICNYFIGNAGGGTFTQLTRSVRPKTLLLNVVPFGWALPNATVVYKHIKDVNGAFLTPEKVIQDHENKYEVEGFDVVNNNADMIYNSVKEWVEFHKNGGCLPIDEHPTFIKQSSKIILYQSRISPAWLSQ
jgi:hypothetical protein